MNSMNTIVEEILEHYQHNPEAERLFRGAGELERIRTQEVIGRYLSAPPAAVLDVGGGPGAYSRWLGEQGYHIELVDPVPLHVEQARANMSGWPERARVHLGDARALAFADGSFDAVLMLGPLYHLTERTDRLRALAEAQRVLRPRGLLVAAGISRFASLLDGYCRALVRDDVFRAILARDLDDGQHRNASERDYFTTAFFHRPEELTAEVAEAGFTVEALIGVEGPFWCLARFEELWQEENMRALTLEQLRRVESEPSIIGASAHLLVVARARSDVF
ncbi:MAG: class I SAM-dependent methyltransferase [Longimicrobiales bacterium]